MKPLTSTIALAATLATANAALAQYARVICETSGDYGVTWSEALTVWPGQRLDVRVRIELVNPSSHFAFGFSGITYQPTLTGWLPDRGDTVVPFSFPGLNSMGVPTSDTSFSGAQVADTLGATGRLAPFGDSVQHPTSASGLLVSFNDPGNTLRFAGSRNTTLTTNTAWGVRTAQAPIGLIGPFFSRELAPVVFRYAVSLSPHSRAVRTLVAQVPFESIPGGWAKFFPCSVCTSMWQVPVLPASIVPAIISVRSRCYADFAGNFQPNPANPAEPPRSLPDGSVTIDDLLYFLEQFELGTSLADLDDGSGNAILDGAVTIDDLLFFIRHFESGC